MVRYFFVSVAMSEDQMKQLLTAERANGCVAMLGIIAALGAYLTTGQIIPGLL